MKKVLIIAYAFPPLGGGEAMRVSKFVKYLPEHGWHPTVLTVSNQEYYVYDNSLLEDISRDVIIHKAMTLEPKLLMKRVKDLLRRNDAGRAAPGERGAAGALSLGIIRGVERIKNALAGAFLIPNEEVLWNPLAFRAARKIIEEERPDMVFTTSPPHSVQLIGRRLKERYAIPWTADFRDAWVGNVLYKPSYGLRARVEERMEEGVVRNADAVISATEPITSAFMRRYPGMPDKFMTITNGFDGEYFKPFENTKGDRFTVTYAGGIGGRRTSKFIYMALVALKQRRPDVYRDLRVRFIGNFYDDRGPWMKNLGGCVEFIAHKPYKEVIPFMQASDVLLLVLHQHEGGQTLATGKLFDYIGARRPILATVPDCVARDMVVRNGLGLAAASNDVDGIVGALAELHGRWKRDGLRLDVPAGLLERYDRRNLAAALARAFDETLKRNGRQI